MIIGLGYRARSGKDTVAQMLVSNFGFQRAAFADTLKQACASVFGFTESQLNGELKEVTDGYWSDVLGAPTTPRKILQLVGTEAFRTAIHQDIWVHSLHRRILTEDKPHWVITDMRFLNEVEAVKKWGGFAVRIDRPGAYKPKMLTKSYLFGLIKRQVPHASESSLDGFEGWDGTLLNDSTLDDLERKVTTMYEKFMYGGHRG